MVEAFCLLTFTNVWYISPLEMSFLQDVSVYENIEKINYCLWLIKPEATIPEHVEYVWWVVCYIRCCWAESLRNDAFKSGLFNDLFRTARFENKQILFNYFNLSSFSGWFLYITSVCTEDASVFLRKQIKNGPERGRWTATFSPPAAHWIGLV